MICTNFCPAIDISPKALTSLMSHFGGQLYGNWSQVWWLMKSPLNCLIILTLPVLKGKVISDPLEA